MNAIDLVIDFFRNGGKFLYPIAAVFAIGVAVAIERFIYLSRVQRGNRALWAQLAPRRPRHRATASTSTRPRSPATANCRR